MYKIVTTFIKIKNKNNLLNNYPIVLKFYGKPEYT